MWKIVRRAVAGVAPKEPFPLGDDLGYQTQRKRKLSKREIHPGRARNSTVSGPQAFGQARTRGDMHERTNWRGWETRKESGWAILTFDQRCPYYLIRYILHFIQPDIPLHIIIPLIYRADLWCSARLAVVRKWFFGGAKEVFSSQGRFERWGRGRYGGIRYGFRRARSRLYRSQILQVNIRWKALAEIYTMHSFAPFSNLNFFVKNCWIFCWFLKNFCKICQNFAEFFAESC